MMPDTLKLAIALRDKAGLPQKQAENLTDIFAEVISFYRTAMDTNSGPYFDTLKLATGLREKAGFSREASEEMALAIAEAAR